MKTKTLLYVALAGLSTACTTHQNDYGTWELKGKVKTCTQTIYKAEEKFGKWEAGRADYSGHYRINFDENGQYTEIDYLDSDGDLQRKEVAAKREDGKLIEVLVYDENGQLDFTTKITYVSDDERVLNRYYNDNYKAHRETKQFREQRKLLGFEQIQTFKDGKIVRSTSSYEQNGATIVDTTVYQYVEGNNSVTTILSDERVYLLYERYEYLEFDEHNNWTKAMLYRCQHTTFTFEGKDTEYFCEDADKLTKPSSIVVRQIEYF